MGGRIRTQDDLQPFPFPNLFHSLNKIYSKRELTLWRQIAQIPKEEKPKSSLETSTNFGHLEKEVGCKSKMSFHRPATGGISRLLVICALRCFTDFMPLVRCRQLSSLLAAKHVTINQFNSSVNISCCCLLIEYPNLPRDLRRSTSNIIDQLITDRKMAVKSNTI